MKRPHFLTKVSVVACSLLLVGGFVSYRAGAFEWIAGARSVQGGDTALELMGSSKSKVIVESSPIPYNRMASSKSMIIVPISAPTVGGQVPASDK
jgi:hypothetical protein